MTRPTLLHFYASLLRKLPRLYVDAFAIYSAVFALPALILFFNRRLAEDVLHAEGVSPWFGLVPLSVLMAILLLRANYDAHASLYDAIQAAQAQASAHSQEPKPHFRLLSGPTFWTASVLPLNGLGQPYIPQGRWYQADPPIKVVFSGSYELAAYGGTKGGILHSLTWSVRDLPYSFRFLAPEYPAIQAIEPNKSVATVGKVTFGFDVEHLSATERALMSVDKDPVLVATYRVDGSDEMEAELVIPRHNFLQAFRYAGARGWDAPEI